MTESFLHAPSGELEITAKQIRKHLILKTDASCSFPSTSMRMHYDRMIISSLKGVYVDYIDPHNTSVQSLKKISSIATRQVSTSYGKVACASGDAGLRQLDLHLESGFHPRESEGLKLNSESCDACDWMYQNISAMSYRGESFLAKFKRTNEYFKPAEVEHPGDEEEDTGIEKIEFVGTEKLTENLTERDVYEKSIAWGAHDKIYRITGNSLESFRFTSTEKRPDLGKVSLPGNADEVVSVRAALFGVAIEFDSSLMVVKSDGSCTFFDGEPINISTFSRSRSYENQLHLIMDDHLNVCSLNSNLDSEGFYQKKFGTRAPEGWFG